MSQERYDDVLEINTRLANVDSDYNVNDRGQFYAEHYQLSGSEGALLEGHISMFSGAAGGNAFAANYLLADYASNPSSPFYSNYSHSQIYTLSQLVAEGFGEAVATNTNPNEDNSDGALSINEGINAAQATWEAFDENEVLENYFPGDGIASYGIFGVLPYPNITVNTLINAANSASFLFGKSLGDFVGVAGHSTRTIDIGNDSDASNDISYVVKHNGDRNNDGIIDYNDGVVVAVANQRWDYVDDVGVGDLLESTDWLADWRAMRDWAPLRQFRQQLTENGTTDFEAYFKTNYSGELSNFWGSFESLFDERGEIRNNLYVYGRYKVGTEDADFLYGGRGNDYLAGGGGNDTIDGGAGDDDIFGGAGDDVIHVGAVGLQHGYGDKTISGGDDLDTIDFSQSSSAVSVNLEAGTAVLRYTFATEGGASSTPYGFELTGIERVTGSSFDDTITGDNAQNTLSGGAGSDTLIGGADVDTYLISTSDAGDDTIDDTTGVLVIDGATVSGAAAVLDDEVDGLYRWGSRTLTREGDDIRLTLDGDSSVLLKNFTSSDYGITLSDTLSGSGEGVSFTRSSQDNSDLVWTGTGQNDYYNSYQSEGDETVYGGAGNDLLITSRGSSLVYAGAGDDTLSGWSGIDALKRYHGGAGNDSLEAAAGGQLWGDDGNDILFTRGVGSLANGGAGNDIIYAATWDFDQLYANRIIYPSSDPMFPSQWAITEASYAASAGGQVLEGGAGNDSLVASGNDILSVDVNLSSGVYSFTYRADLRDVSGQITVAELSSSSQISGFEVIDTRSIGYGGSVHVVGNSEDNLISSGNGTDSIHGGNGNDTISSGSAGDDRVYGDAGDDTLIIGTIANGLPTSRQTAWSGGSGYDTIRFEYSSGGSSFIGTVAISEAEEIHYFGSQISGHATYQQISNTYTLGAFILSKNSNGLLVQSGGNAFLLTDWSSSNQYGITLDEVISGSEGNDTIESSTSSETIFGGSGEDQIYFNGSFGQDTVFGGEQIYINNSRIEGQAAYDINSFGWLLQGYVVDKDNVIITTPSGSIRLADWSETNNYGITFTEAPILGTNSAELLSGTSGNDTIYALDGNDTINSNEGDDVVFGGNGNDLIYAGDGVNTIEGGAGNDIIEIMGVSSHNRISGAEVIRFNGLDITGNGVYSFATNSYSLLGGFVTLTQETAGIKLATSFGSALLTDYSTSNNYGFTFTPVIQGTAGNDTLSGTAGNDTLYGGAGDDVMNGGAGVDAINLLGNFGNDTITGGEAIYQNGGLVNWTLFFDATTQRYVNGALIGTETPEGLRVAVDGSNSLTLTDYSPSNTYGITLLPNVLGGSGNDTLFGTINNDRIDGSGGNDNISAAAGVDRIYFNGTFGNDSVSGGEEIFINHARVSGTATYNATSGSYALGTYTLQLAANGLTLSAGTAGTIRMADWSPTNTYGIALDTIPGATINGTNSTESLTGTFGSDIINALAGNDTVFGRDGDDTIDGGANSDTLYGDAGNDVLYLTNNDNAFGGAGNDTYVIRVNPTGTVLLRDFDVTNHSERVDISAFNITDFNALTFSTLSDGSAALMLPNAQRVVFQGLESYYLNELNFTGFTAATAPQYGTVANDTINGSNTARDVIAGGDGNDRIDGRIGDDLLHGDAGDDYVMGGDGQDMLLGWDGNDTLLGGNGDDRLRGGNGNDSLQGNDGNDDIYGDNGIDTIRGGNGNDSLYGGNEADLMYGDAGDDSMRASIGDDTMYGGDGNDVIFGRDNNDVLYGNAGIDTLWGGTGDDRLYAGSLGGLVYGEDGNDTISGSTSAALLDGGLGNDSITGGVGSETLQGGDGDDRLNGGNGDDSITGGIGADVLTGGNGTDTLLGGDGNDTISGTTGLDTLWGGLGDDSLVAASEGGIVYGEDGNDTLRGSIASVLLSGGAGNDSIVGGNGNETLDGGIGDDTINGGNGDDMLYGREGNDLISGSNGNDSAEGGDGNDTINGNAGFDTLWGGLGDDSITGSSGGGELYGDDGNDILRGSNLNDLMRGGTGNDTLIANAGDDTLYGDAGTDSITGSTGADSMFGGEDADTIRGSDGNDSIYGDAGADSLFGDNGDDVLSGGADADTLTGGRGNDVLTGGDGADSFLISRTDLGTADTVNADTITDLTFTGDVLSLVSYRTDFVTAWNATDAGPNTTSTNFAAYETIDSAEDLYSLINLMTGLDGMRVLIDATADALIFDFDDELDAVVQPLSLEQDLLEGRVLTLNGGWAEDVLDMLGGINSASVQALNASTVQIVGMLSDGTTLYDMAGKTYVNQLA